MLPAFLHSHCSLVPALLFLGLLCTPVPSSLLCELLSFSGALLCIAVAHRAPHLSPSQFPAPALLLFPPGALFLGACSLSNPEPPLPEGVLPGL